MKRLMLFFAAVLIIAAGCGKPAFRIGFVGGLTGKMSDLGISGRNGLQLAVKNINEAGGISGRPVELMIRNDKNDPRTAETAVRDLIDSGADVIVGHMVSSMSLQTIPIVNKHQIPMISPTTSTPELSGRDDYFIRVMPENTAEVRALVEFFVEKQNIRSAAAIIDLSNDGYTLPWWKTFQTAFISRGGEVKNELFYDSEGDIDYAAIVREAAAGRPEGLVLITNAFDTAMFCQQAAKQDIASRIIPCGWAMTEDLIRHGGKTVEGLYFITAIYSELESKEYVRFKREYSEQFGSPPDFAAVHAYDAAMLIRQACGEKKREESLKEAIVRIGTFSSLQGSLTIDKYGDAEREYHVIVIRDGAFVRRR